jgi:uncharacterized ferritin-like protein (DUF455 family)
MSDPRLDPALFAAEGPTRDSRFVVKQFWRDMANQEADHDLEFLHRQMAEEIESIEMCARNLADFPDAPWELRMEIARQAWDEARHVVAFRRLFEQRGGRVGQFPVLDFQYRIIMRLESLAGRLSVANRSFEASGIDAIADGMANAQKADDLEFIALFDQQLADEIQHVRYANDWVPKLLAAGGPRAVFDMARSVSNADAAFKLVAGDAMTQYPVAEDVRREAGFDDAEIETARRFAAR